MPPIFHVLLTGGVGSRLWPLSRQSRPKQYLQLFSASSLRVIGGSESSDNCIEKSDVTSSVFSDGGTIRENVSRSSLFELAVTRNAAFSDGLIVVGNQGNCQLSDESLKKLNISRYTHIVEATPRNTAPAIAFAAFAANAEDILLVTPADHIINEGEAYDKAILQAIGLAENDSLVTFGVNLTKPETGYGYIEFEGDDVLSFREKPNRGAAEEFIETGKFLWNSGMFCFKAGVFLEELEKYAPEVYKTSKAAWENSVEHALEMESSLKIPAISVDYAVMEKSEKIKVVKADFEWSDMGSFEAVYDYLRDQGTPVDDAGNMTIGTKNYTAFTGLSNCILVQTKDANLVLAKEASQDVKNIYQTLESEHPELIN